MLSSETLDYSLYCCSSSLNGSLLTVYSLVSRPLLWRAKGTDRGRQCDGEECGGSSKLELVSFQKTLAKFWWDETLRTHCWENLFYFLYLCRCVCACVLTAQENGWTLPNRWITPLYIHTHNLPLPNFQSLFLFWTFFNLLVSCPHFPPIIRAPDPSPPSLSYSTSLSIFPHSSSPGL